jgi:hypothetical protein
MAQAYCEKAAKNPTILVYDSAGCAARASFHLSGSRCVFRASCPAVPYLLHNSFSCCFFIVLVWNRIRASSIKEKINASSQRSSAACGGICLGNPNKSRMSSCSADLTGTNVGVAWPPYLVFNAPEKNGQCLLFRFGFRYDRNWRGDIYPTIAPKSTDKPLLY